MKTLPLAVVVTALVLTGMHVPAFGHCEIPCGIYGDQMRIDMIAEHTRTIEKSMNMIRELGDQEDVNYNQLVRWINNKELHANKIQEIVYQYFMNQRVKPVEDSGAASYQKYVRQITLLHRMLVQAMKAKQTTDLGHVQELRSLLDAFKTAYMEPDSSDHGHRH